MGAEKPFAVSVIVRGLIVSVILMLSFVIESAVTGAITADPNSAGLIGFLGTFSALFLVGAWLSWRENKWGFLLTAIVSLFFVLLFGSFLPVVLANPATFGTFARFATLFFVLVLVLVFALFAFKHAGPALRTRPSLATANSPGGLFTFLMIGVIVGTLIVGLTAGQYIDRIVSKGAAPPGAVTIVRGAVNNASDGDTFSPALKTIVMGGTVIWWNGDLTSHTVTSEDTGAFESGEIESGTFWSHRFTAPGDFPYFCTPHPYMQGTVNVTT